MFSCAFAFREIMPLSREPVKIIKFAFRPVAAQAPFAHKPGTVSGFFQQSRIGFGKLFRGKRHIKTVDGMRACIKSAEYAGPACHTYRCCTKMVGKGKTLGRERIQIGRFYNGISHTAHGVPAMVIGQQKQNIGFLFSACPAKQGRADQGK